MLAAAPARASLSSSGPFAIDSGQALIGIACPSSSQCTALDYAGGELTFDPADPAGATRVQIVPGATAVACPTTTQCTIVTTQGSFPGDDEWTFDPRNGHSVHHADVDIDSLDAVSCPTVSQCTAVDDKGSETTFNPVTANGGSPKTLSAGFRLSGVACPSTTQCTAVTTTPNNGNYAEWTFNPTAVVSASGAIIANASPLMAVACPTTHQCTAVDNSGGEATFDPASGTTGATTVDPGSLLSSVACPAASFCAIVDEQAGSVLGGNPNDPAGFASAQLANSDAVFAVSCISTTECIVVGDANAYVVHAPPSSVSSPTISGTAVAGQTLTEQHGGWSPTPDSYGYLWEDCNAAGAACQPIAGATVQTYTLTASDLGHTIRVAESATLSGAASLDAYSAPTAVVVPEPPHNLSPPTITGTPARGQTLTEQHGRWTPTPTGYGYQWQDCDASGGNCRPISGATSRTYVLATADVGHTIRVRETATDPGGAGGAATSAATTVIGAAAAHIAIRTRHAKVNRHGFLNLKLSCRHRDPNGTCTGKLTLQAPIKRHIRRHGKQVTVTRWIAIAHRRYRLRAGTSGRLRLRLTRRGRHLLAHARHHRLPAPGAATVSGGHRAHHRVVLRPAQRHHL